MSTNYPAAQAESGNDQETHEENEPDAYMLLAHKGGGGSKSKIHYTQ